MKLHTLVKTIIALTSVVCSSLVTAQTRVVSIKNTLCISVLDHGPGIASEQRERVFDRFYRDIDAQGSGSGLGLSIAQQIVSLHRAEIILDSAESGEGLSATVVFKQARHI